MKLKSTLLAATLAVFAASTPTLFAAEEHPADAPAKGTSVGVPPLYSDPSAAKTEKTEAAKAKKPLKKKVKKHSHVEEKTGMPMPEPMPAEGKVLPKNRHEHTKDRH